MVQLPLLLLLLLLLPLPLLPLLVVVVGLMVLQPVLVSLEAASSLLLMNLISPVMLEGLLCGRAQVRRPQGSCQDEHQDSHLGIKRRNG